MLPCCGPKQTQGWHGWLSDVAYQRCQVSKFRLTTLCVTVPQAYVGPNIAWQQRHSGGASLAVSPPDIPALDQIHTWQASMIDKRSAM